jgi:hypothetical protein
MLEKWLLTVSAITSSFVLGVGYAWVEGAFESSTDAQAVAQQTAPTLAPGPHGFGNATPLSSPSPKPTPAGSAAEAAVPHAGLGPGRTTLRLTAPPSDTTSDTAGTTPGTTTDTTGTDSTATGGGGTTTTTTSGAPGTQFNLATFNLLGSSHTKAHSDSPRFASGPARMTGALQILAQHQVSVVGLQEFQPDQRQAFQSKAVGWAMYPGLSMGRRAGENSVAWRTDTWDAVQTKVTPIPYFNGRIRPMPYVLLRNKATGAQAWFATFHNPADVRQFQHQQPHRTEATTRETRLANDLTRTGFPVFITGDMNERQQYFCRMTAETPLVAAAGGGNSGGCRPPKPIGIDWLFGSPSARFSDYTVDRSALVRRTTDHPVVVAHVTLS